MVKYEADIHTEDVFLGDLLAHKQYTVGKGKHTVYAFKFNLPSYISDNVDLYLLRTSASKMDIHFIMNANKQASKSG